MFNSLLNQFRERIHDRQFVVTSHAEEEMSDDGVSIFDVEHAVLTGNIAERQKDPKSRIAIRELWSTIPCPRSGRGLCGKSAPRARTQWVK